MIVTESARILSRSLSFSSSSPRTQQSLCGLASVAHFSLCSCLHACVRARVRACVLVPRENSVFPATTRRRLSCLWCGAPIPVVQEAEPSDEPSDAIWAQYIAQIEGLYATYKNKYGYPDNETLVLMEARKSGGGKAAAAAAGGKPAASVAVAAPSASSEVAASAIPATPADDEVQPEGIIEDEAEQTLDLHSSSRCMRMRL